MKFKDRYVTKKGTIYCQAIGTNYDTSDKKLKEVKKEIEFLKGQKIIVNGKESTVIDAQISGRCNLTFTRYYIDILTDEEFV